MSPAELSREELIEAVVAHQEGLEQLQQLLAVQQQRIEVLEAENADLRAQLGGGAGGSQGLAVKPNRAARRANKRKKREHNFVRHREEPTRVVTHQADHCPDCGHQLAGGSACGGRQIIDIPSQAVEITEHQYHTRYCGYCKKTVRPKVDLSEVVVGNSRIGINLMSYIVHWHTVCRIPLATIQSLLQSLYELHLSKGELTEIMHRTAELGKEQYLSLRDLIRGSPVVHADETSWREDGINGYIWSFSTPKISFFAYNRSRAGAVPMGVLGDQFTGAIVTDFYGAYNCINTERQCCWVHLLRDVHKLKEKHPEDASVAKWAAALRTLYDHACAFASADAKVRVRARERYQEKAMRLALPFLNRADKPQHILCKRIDNFIDELFVFVQYPDVPSENNAAERAVRPAVIARKISGGTRSPKGSQTKMTLMSLCYTWLLRGLDPAAECAKMLRLSQQSTLLT